MTKKSIKITIMLGSLMFFGYATITNAQSEPREIEPPAAYQRTIISEEEQAEILGQSSASSKSGLYGLGAAVMLLVAVGAGYVYWVKDATKIKPVTPPNP